MMLSCQVRSDRHDLNSWLSQIYADGAQANQSIYAAMGLGTFNVDGDFASPYEQFASVAGTQSDSPTPHYDVSDEEAQDQGDEGEEEEEEEESDSADVDEDRSQEERPPVKGPYPARDPYWGLAPLNVFDFSYRQMSAAEQKYILRMLGEWDVDMADPHKAGFLSWSHIRRLVEDTRDLPNPPALPSKEDYKAFSECTPRWPLASSKKTSQPEEGKPKGDHKRKDRAKGAGTLGRIQQFKQDAAPVSKGQGGQSLITFLKKHRHESNQLLQYRKETTGPCNICPVVRMVLTNGAKPIKNEAADKTHVGSQCRKMQKALGEHFGQQWRGESPQDEQKTDASERESKRHKRSSYAEPRGRGKGRGRGHGRGRGSGR